MPSRYAAGTLLLLSGLANGCAPYKVPERWIATNWVAVASIPAGTMVLVNLDNGKPRRGAIETVTDGALTFRDGDFPNTFRRDSIVRVSILTPFDPPRWKRLVRGALNGVAASAIPAALFGGYVGAEHESGRGAAALVLVVGAAAGATIAASSTRPSFRERLVYIRP